MAEHHHKTTERWAESLMLAHVRANVRHRGCQLEPPLPGWEEVCRLGRHTPWLAILAELVALGWAGPPLPGREKAARAPQGGGVAEEGSWTGPLGAYLKRKADGQGG
jgi:hypothetical protein